MLSIQQYSKKTNGESSKKKEEIHFPEGEHGEK